ncbi:MAG: SoxR reducing system RseC family protein [Thermotogae bacterium]|nr:SoxR reducing system RseC family protein [Thermotogota bacterium]
MTVSEITDKYIFLQAERISECESCSSQGSCSVIPGDNKIKIKAKNENNMSLKPGDCVSVKLPEFSISKVSFIVYGIPLLVFIALTVIMYIAGVPDVYSFLSGLAGMAVAYIIISVADRKIFKDKYLPEIIEKINNFKVQNG